MKKSVLFLIAVCSGCLLSSCAAGNTTTVQPIQATHFSVTPATTTTTAGTPFNFTVTALDSSNAMVSSYSATAQLASSDGRAVLPANSMVTNGTGTFSATLKTIGLQTITATAGSIAGTSISIAVTAVPGNPVPFVNVPLSPGAAIPGVAAFQLTVNGTGFVPSSMVKWNGTTRVTSFMSDSQLTATVLASDIVNANTASVTVVNPAPGGGSSNVAFFETTKPTAFASWSVPSTLPAGTNPSSAATADFNGDGKQDIVVTNGGSNNINIFLGNGDGTFQPAITYPAGTNPDSVAVGDFNGDGKLDFAVANSGSGNVGIFLGNGNGTFQAAVNYLAGTNPSSVAVGDFTGDGKLDLAVANSASGNVSILLGYGDGTFQPAVDYPAGTSPSCIAVGDFNGDGKLDLAVGNIGAATGDVSILLGNGDGTFRSAVTYVARSSASSVALGDFNGDGKLDLAVTDGNDTISILLGNGDGTFQTVGSYIGGSGASSVVVGDFNGDGKLDLAVANSSSIGTGFFNVGVLLGNGDGTFQVATDHAAGATPSSIAVGDFNGDGRMDLAVTDKSRSTVSVLLYPVLAGPNATFSSTILDFGTQIVGTTSANNFILLSNDGTATLSIMGISANTNYGESNNCGSSLAAGASCNVSLTFSPTAIDSITGTLSITDNAPASPQTISLMGVGTVVALTPNFMSFTCGYICPPGPKTATLTNTGATSLSITSISTSSPLVGSIHAFQETNNCPENLGAGQSCSIVISFNGVPNTRYNGTLIVNDNGGGSPQTVSLTGIL